MTELRRLFDCIDYQLQQNSLPDMLTAKENGQWKSYSTREVRTLVDQLSAGLLAQGMGMGDGSIEGRDKIALISKNRPEWMILDLAVQQIGAVLTPVYPTIGVIDLEFILNDAKVKTIFVNDEDLFHKVMSVTDSVPTLVNIFIVKNPPLHPNLLIISLIFIHGN